VEIGCRVYRPRRPRESPLFQLVERHLEELLQVWPTRFVRRHGPLRPVVERVLREFLRCGLLEQGSLAPGAVSAGAVCWWPSLAAAGPSGRRARRSDSLTSGRAADPWARYRQLKQRVPASLTRELTG
jgi:hypothetical protein